VLSAARPPSGVRPVAATGPSVAGSEVQVLTSGLKLRGQPGDVKQAVRERAIDTVLNAASMLADMWDDFRRRDRFFKYKAAIVATWAVLSITSFFVAFPSDSKNRLGARLVMAGDASRPVYMIVNDSGDTWHEVTVIANNRYRTAVGLVEPRGGTLTFIPKQLKGDQDTAPPSDLQISDLQLRTDDGSAWLMKEGELR